MHSACWDNTVDLSGKRVAVIGAGSSGIQIVPEIAAVAASVTSFNRCVGPVDRSDHAHARTVRRPGSYPDWPRA